MSRTVAIIGAGQIGNAAAWNFETMGWKVVLYTRSQPSDAFEWESNKWEWRPYVAGEDPAPKADLVLDTIAFDEADVGRYDPAGVGRLITISSASVYCDSEGRTLDEAAVSGFPEYHGPITEDYPTTSPGPATYSTRKVRMENKAIELFGDRATILRPCAIFGIPSRHPREWWFVKRLLDGRQRIPLAFGGQSQFQTTSASDIAEFCENAATLQWGGIYNIATENAPSVLEIGKAISEALNKDVEFELLSGTPVGTVGRTPWSIPGQMIVSSRKSLDAGDGLGKVFGVSSRYDSRYISGCVKWLADFSPPDWRTAFPTLASYPYDQFDYAAEDRFFDELR